MSLLLYSSVYILVSHEEKLSDRQARCYADRQGLVVSSQCLLPDQFNASLKTIQPVCLSVIDVPIPSSPLK